jgi:glycine betaine/proline transport system ATP-binding protein
VFITHDLNEAMRLGDSIAVMRDGRIVQQGTAEDILTRPADDYVASFVQDVDRSRVLTADAVMDEAPAGADVCACPTVSADTPLADLCAVSARVPHPVAVTDADGSVVGSVPQDRLVAFIGDEPRPPMACACAEVAA